MTIRAIELYCNSDKGSAKSKHIDIKFLVIKDKVRNHIMSVNSVITIFNIALFEGELSKLFFHYLFK